MKLQGQILGRMSNQIGKSMVFFMWKGIQVARQYAKPSNPDTIAQQTQRGKFGELMVVSQGIINSIINKFWKAFAVKQSAFNAFMSTNLLLQTYPLVQSMFQFAKGTLSETPITSVTYDPVEFIVTANYNTVPSGNQSAGDLACLVICGREAETSMEVFVADTGATRSDGTISYSLPHSLENPNYYFAYLFFYRNLGTSSQYVSNSVKMQLPA
jgi:hypothetical protein